MRSGIMLISVKQQLRPTSSAASTPSPRNHRSRVHQMAPLSRSISNRSLLEELEDSDLGYTLASSMLQQILQDMYIDPDLLAELEEEQKQILFCKMREEQVRRYEESEKQFEKENKKKPQSKKKVGKQVNFKTGKDGNPWTWVMGDHPEDKTIEQILEDEAMEKARKLAEEEADRFRNQMEEQLAKEKKEEEEKLEKDRKKEEELRRKAAEAATYQTLKEARLVEKQLEQEKKKKEEEEKRKRDEMKRKQEYRRSNSLQEVNNLVTRRLSEIYGTLQNDRKKSVKQAEEQSKRIEEEWKQQEKKAKEIEKEREKVARWAREEHRRSRLQKTQMVGRLMMGMKKGNNNSHKPPIPGKKPDLGGRPPNKEAIIRWFTEKERPNGAGLDPSTEQVATWFHGVISRRKAEELLEDQKEGTYLVRVSERIWGYAISYRGTNNFKHFLVDAGEEGYQFFGTNQIPHPTLSDLITYHKDKPISHSGKELLRFPCGQSCDPPDYQELFQGTEVEVSAL